LADPSPGKLPSERPTEDQLDSWKEIAAYLNRDVTTVQRWEKREGMPVHRHLHNSAGSVSAFRSELDAWMRGRSLRTAPENGNNVPLPAPMEPEPQPLIEPATAPADKPASRGRWNFVLPIVAATALVAIGAILWIQRTGYFWRNPIADARFETVTDFDGVATDAAISRDGKFIAFLSDRAGQMDVWLTQVGSGQFHNLTGGRVAELPNSSVRTVGFSPNGEFVTFWLREQKGPNPGKISVWAVPTLGGEPSLYMDGVAEFDWSQDASRLVFHLPGPGDPLFVSNGRRVERGNPIYTAPPGLHCHFPLWSPDAKFVYFVQGTIPGKLDIWRMPAAGGTPERITAQNGRVTYPVLVDGRTLLYVATDADGSGPWLYSTDVERRVAHRLTSGLDRFTSVAASADGQRLVLTLASPKRTLWRLPISNSAAAVSAPVRISLTTGAGFSPRLGPNYLLYVSATQKSDSIWKLVDGTSTELWTFAGARLLGGPAVSSDGQQIAFAVRQDGQKLLYVMQPDGSKVRVVANSLDLEGDPAWARDGQSITAAAYDQGVPHLFRVPLDGGAPAVLVHEYSRDPAWASDGGFVAYSGADIATTFSVQAAGPDAVTHPLPPLTLSRGARRLVFLPGGSALVLLRGQIQHKDLWLLDLKTGSERQLTNFASDFDIRDFDVSADGSELVLERQQERSDVVMLDRAHH
jgi:Tol biopolymer transport system component